MDTAMVTQRRRSEALSRIKSGIRKQSTGFTLLEVIVTIVVASILGTLLIEFMMTNLSGSAESVVSLQTECQIEKALESITRDYRNWLRDNPNENLNLFKALVDGNTYANPPVTVQTDANFEVDSGNDSDIEILRVTVSDGEQNLMALFTK
jgi:prepilin-type N-terminal cleavage/methylation domain-containing protein